MHILFASPHHDPGTWLSSFQTAMPGARFSVWDPSQPPTEAEIAIGWQPSAEVFAHERHIKTLFNLGAGVDALLALPTLPPELTLVRLEDAGMSVQMAEYVVHALARVMRNFDGYAQDQASRTWGERPELARRHWPVGVLGLGVVGQRVASALASLDFPVAAWSRTARDIDGLRTFAGVEGLDAFLRQTRVLVNVLPLTPETHNLIDRDLMSKLLPEAMVINVGRGKSLVEEDLLAMLDSGHVRAAALDVFQTEPLPADHPFWRHPQVVVTPHIAARTLLEETVEQIVGKLRRLAEGKEVTGVVSRDRGY